MEMKEYIKLFLKHCPDLVQAMNNSDHNYSGDFPNPYHIEGTVFTHTQLVCLMAERFKVNDLVKLACLLHDVGKPMSQELVHEKQRTRFINHEGLGVFIALDSIKKMGISLPYSELTRLVQLLSMHTMLFRAMEKPTYVEDLKVKFKGNKALLSDLIWLSKCDALGRFTDTDNKTAEEMEILLKPVLDSIDDKAPECSKSLSATVLCGPPLSGKTKWINENVDLGNTVVVSRDDIVMRLGNGLSYSESWKSIDQTLVDKEYQVQKHLAVAAGKNIVFDLTNCSAKARRACLASLSPKTYNKKAVVLYSGYDDLLARNLARTASEGKFIPHGALVMLMKAFISPLYDEVDEVTSIFNVNE